MIEPEMSYLAQLNSDVIMLFNMFNLCFAGFEHLKGRIERYGENIAKMNNLEV